MQEALFWRTVKLNGQEVAGIECNGENMLATTELDKICPLASKTWNEAFSETLKTGSWNNGLPLEGNSYIAFAGKEGKKRLRKLGLGHLYAASRKLPIYLLGREVFAAVARGQKLPSEAIKEVLEYYNSELVEVEDYSDLVGAESCIHCNKSTEPIGVGGYEIGPEIELVKVEHLGRDYYEYEDEEHDHDGKLMPLELREVDFHGSKLVGIRANNGKVYVGVAWVCRGIGLSKSQISWQRRSILSDSVLKKGVVKIPIPTIYCGRVEPPTTYCSNELSPMHKNKEEKIVCLELDFVPLWLAKINPRDMSPEVKERLEEYQLKAKDVLVAAFLKNIPLEGYLRMSQVDRAIAYFQQLKKNEKLTSQLMKIKPRYDQFLNAQNAQPMNTVAKVLDTGSKRLFKFLRDKGILMKNNVPYQKYLDRGYFEVKEKNIKVGNKTITISQTLVLPKGKIFIYKLLKRERNKNINLKEKGEIYDQTHVPQLQ